MITFERIYEAYLDCNKRKANKPSALQFSVNLIEELQNIVDDINNRQYIHSRSSCFVVTEPTPREIYAAQYRDRIIQHFFVQEIMPILDETLVPNTTSCRKGKGTSEALRLAKECVTEITKNGKLGAWYLKIDISGYFMSIRRKFVTKLMVDLIERKYKGSYKEEVLYLAPIIYMNDPAKDRFVRCSLKLLDTVPARKKMDVNSECGLAIGNITAQVGSNLELNELDHYIIEELGFSKMVRYVDDVIVLGNSHQELANALPKIEAKLAEIGHAINRNKTYIDSVYHGVKFVGKVTYPYGYQKSTKASAGRVMKAARSMPVDGKLLSRLNSQCGRFKHYSCYNLLQDFLKALPKEVWKYVEFDKEKFKFKELKKHGNLRNGN